MKRTAPTAPRTPSTPRAARQATTPPTAERAGVHYHQQADGSFTPMTPAESLLLAQGFRPVLTAQERTLRATKPARSARA